MILLFVFVALLYASKTYLYCGIGFPEMLNSGIRCSIGRHLLIGTGIAIAPYKNGIMYCASLDGTYYFSHIRQCRNASWFLRSGALYTHDISQSQKTQDVWLPLAFGREIPITCKLSIGLDLGGIINLWHKKTEYSTGWFDFDFFSPVLPTARVQLLWTPVAR